MLQFFAKRLRDAQTQEEGFTLIELLVVVIIIGILAAIAIPAYLAQRDSARNAVVDSDARQAGTAINACLLATSQASCDTQAEVEAYGYNPSTAVLAVANPPTFTTVGATDIQLVVTHRDNTAITATYRSDTGQVT